MPKKTMPPFVIYLFFIIGVISAIGFRVIIVLNYFDPDWSRIVWYIAVIGYIAFFLYRFVITERRRKTIARYDLIQKLEKNACLTDEDREANLYLLRSLDRSLEKYNYGIIFLLSVLAVAADIILSLIKS